MESKDPKKKRFYLKWPWNLAVYVVLVIILRIFSIPFICIIMWWNKKQQPDGPEEGYCLQRTRGQLIQLVWAAVFLLVGASGAAWLVSAWMEDHTTWEYMDYITLIISGVAAVGGTAAAIYEVYIALRDTLCPAKSTLAKSIRSQLPYPDEAPPVQELFAMVDQDIKENGQWFGKLAIGKKWVLGDEVSSISRIRGVFGRNERRISNSGGRTRATLIVQLWIVDDRRQLQLTDLKTPQELEGAMDCLYRLAPAAMFGGYDSKEYNALVHASEEEWQASERAYRQRKARFEEQERQEQERQAQNQVLTLPDGSVTSRISGDSLRQLLLQCRRVGETRSFQLVPGVPFRGEGRTFSRLVCFPGGGQEPVQLFLEEYSGSPSETGKYGWLSEVSLGEAETALGNWIRGDIPSLTGWTPMERTGQGWMKALERR